MKLCSYIIVHDKGLAPNPFWEYCTLGVCTPNHQGAKVEIGDWIIGTEQKSKGNKLIYAMKVSEILGFDDYFRDSRFERKKPKIQGASREKCGDNFYFKNNLGNWQKLISGFHDETHQQEQDLKHPFVFVSNYYFYFGGQAIELPKNFSALIQKRQGIKWHREQRLILEFCAWLSKSHQPGLIALPRDFASTHLIPLSQLI
jgi:hypothetical protein